MQRSSLFLASLSSSSLVLGLVEYRNAEAHNGIENVFSLVTSCSEKQLSSHHWRDQILEYVWKVKKSENSLGLIDFDRFLIQVHLVKYIK